MKTEIRLNQQSDNLFFYQWPAFLSLTRNRFKDSPGQQVSAPKIQPEGKEMDGGGENNS